MMRLSLNGLDIELDLDPSMPLLWAIRDHAGLTGTKYGCGIAQCGACAVYLNGAPVRSCSLPLARANGARVTTIEGLDTPVGRAVQQAWAELDVVQCGFCQSGQIMAAVDLLNSNPAPTDDQIDGAMYDNLCRCATYARIRAAIHKAAAALA